MSRDPFDALVVGCGYLGRRVAVRLTARGWRTAATTRSPQKAEQLEAVGITPVLADVLKPETLTSLPPTRRLFYAVSPDRSAGSTPRQVYVEGLQSLLDAMRGRIGGLVQASSTGVYAQTDGSWVDEDSPTEPASESGQALLEAESVARAFSGTEVASIVVRFAGLYGPERIIGRKALENGKPIPGDPDWFVNLVHVDDAAEAATRAILGEVGWPVLIASDDRPTPRGDCYRLTARLLNAPQPRFDPGARRSGRGETHKRVLNGRLRAVLGDDLRYPSIEEGLPAALAAESAK